MPYFTVEPKYSKDDLFDRRAELVRFTRYVEYKPLTIVSGPRRIGKTSLVNVGLKELNMPYILIDCRLLPVNPSRRVMLSLLEGGLNRLLILLYEGAESLKEYLGRVKGVFFEEGRVRLVWRRRDHLNLCELVEVLDEWGRDHGFRVALILDEAQNLKGVKEVVGLLAHIYDYNLNIAVVLTTSQKDYLYETLRLNDPSSPLYGRLIVEVSLKPFNESESYDFLVEGFKQHRVYPPGRVLEYAVKRLGGIPGWLTMFGVEALEQGVYEEVVDRVLEKASYLAMSDLELFLRRRLIARRRYLEVLKAIAMGLDRWSLIRGYLEAREGCWVPDSTIANILDSLRKAQFISYEGGRYVVKDPALTYALKSRSKSIL
ncbi:MAG: ATP-binding protein [Thermoprotei archaeon]|nr:MAG: ATP-binding protein [Thermoprotei archaeon]